MTQRLAIEAAWTDESVPDLGRILTPRLGVDLAAFAEWLGPLLGDCRERIRVQKSLPTPSSEVAYAKATVAALREAADLLDRHSFPDRLSLDVFMLAQRKGVDWRELSSRIRKDLKQARMLLEAVNPPTETRPAKAGAKSKKPRDELVAAIVARLRQDRIKAEPARELAAQILVACGIEADVKDMKRAARKGQK